MRNARKARQRGAGRRGEALVFEMLERRDLMASDAFVSDPAVEYSGDYRDLAVLQGAAKTTTEVFGEPASAPFAAGEGLQHATAVAINLPAGLPPVISLVVPFQGEVFTLALEKHSVFGANTRFLIDDGAGRLEEVAPGPDRSYLGTVAGHPEYAVSAQLTDAGLMASIIRPNQPSITIEPTNAIDRAGMHRVFVELKTAAHNHDHDDDGHAHEKEEVAAFVSAPQTSVPEAEALPAAELTVTDAAPLAMAGGGGSTATLPPTRVVQVREFEVGVEIGSRAFFASSAYNGNLATAQASAASIATNMDARYLHGAGIKHTVGTVIIRTNAATDPLRDSVTATGAASGANSSLSAFRNYWNNNPGEVGTTHDLAIYHVLSAPSGLAYVNSVGTSSRYATSGGNGATSWANGTAVHELGHSWSLGHVPGSPSSSYYESKPRNNNGSNSSGGSDVFVSVMHGGGSHNIGRLSSGEANQVYNKGVEKATFGTPYTPGPVKPFGRVDSALASGSAITIDVIANDYDSNNDVLDVRLLDTVSQQGGAISLSMGTGPGGRNQIVYTPSVGANGTDFFHYTVFDTTGRTDWGAVYVENESAIVIDTDQTKFDYDFGTSTSPVLGSQTVDWQRISPNTFGDINWSTNVSATDRGGNVGANDANRDFVTASSAATLEHKLANGVWSVVLNMGDATTARDNMAIWAEGELITNNISSPAGQFSYVSSSGASPTPTSFNVTVIDGSLSLTFDDLGGADPSWVINRMTLQLVDASPQVLDVIIDPATGRAVLQNNTLDAVSFDGYTFQDTAPSLQPETWFSLQDQGYSGGVWFEAAPSVFQLPELTIDGATTLAPGQVLYLGRIVDPVTAQNLTFDYFLSDTLELSRGVIQFADPGVPALPGDYNRDFQVDGVDYAIWRESLGDAIESFAVADGNGDGVVDSADHRLWLRNYGNQVLQELVAAPQSAEAEATGDGAVARSFAGAEPARDEQAFAPAFRPQFRAQLRNGRLAPLRSAATYGNDLLSNALLLHWLENNAQATAPEASSAAEEANLRDAYFEEVGDSGRQSGLDDVVASDLL